MSSVRNRDIEKDLEVPGGFEPPNNGFADRPLGPLGHGTFRLPHYNPPLRRARPIYLDVFVKIE